VAKGISHAHVSTIVNSLPFPSSGEGPSRHGAGTLAGAKPPGAKAGAKKGKKIGSSASTPTLLSRIRPVVNHPVASPRLIATINPEGWASTGISFRTIYSTSPLPVFAPRTVKVRTLCNGTHTMADLGEATTVADIALELHTRLMLPPWRAVLLSHWGRELEPAHRLAEAGLHTASILEAAIKYTDPDRRAPLARIRIASAHLVTRHFAATPSMLVRELKAEIEAFYKRGVHVWYDAEGKPRRAEGATLLCKFTKPLDAKNLTSSMVRGEQFVQVGLGGDKKDKWRCHRADSGNPAQLGFDDAVKLDLPPKAQSLLYNGVALSDELPLSAYRIVHNDAVLLSFENPALRAVDAAGRGGAKKAPPKKK
jgi:hypothetical protein